MALSARSGSTAGGRGDAAGLAGTGGAGAASLKATKDLSTSQEPARSGSGRLLVTPGCVNFQGVVAGTTYAMAVRIQNVSKASCRVRVNTPASSKFKVTLPKGGAIAPGLEVIADVEFTCTDGAVRAWWEPFAPPPPTLSVATHEGPVCARGPVSQPASPAILWLGAAVLWRSPALIRVGGVVKRGVGTLRH